MASRTKKVTGERFSKRGALKMYTGGKDDPRTRYNCAVIEEARKRKVMVEIAPGEFANPRQVHRPDFLGRFSSVHERAGEGKYVAAEAVDGKRVIGAQHVNPYLASDGSYRMIVSTFHHLTGKSLESMEAKIAHSRENGTHLIWQGKRTSDDAVVCSPWVTAEELYEAAQQLNKKLATKLRQSKSPRKGVKSHLGSFDKFVQNLDVMRRATQVRDMATGEVSDDKGGASPCAKPLEQSGFAIDMAFMTSSINKDGTEIGEFFYRMAYGRAVPHKLSRGGWMGMDADSKIAYKDEKIRAAAKKAATKRVA